MTTLSGGKRVTMRDIAAAAKVPVSSVALVLNDKPGVSSTRRETVLAAARSLGYEQPRVTRARVLGLLVEDLGYEAKLDGFIDSIVHGVYAAAGDVDTHVVLAVHRRGLDPLMGLRSVTGRDVDGMILTNGGDITREVVQSIVDTGIPTVLVENYVDLPVDAVIADNLSAGYACTQHLLELGHRRIGLLKGSSRYVSLTDRARGHLAALWEAGVQPDPFLMPDQPAGTEPKGYAQTLALLGLPEPPTAIYAVSDKSARGAYQAIIDRGLQVGKDIAVVGTDNVEESAFRSPPLTTYDVHAHSLGEEAVRVLSSRLGGHQQPTRTIIPGALIVRESTAHA
ncbi:LacI family DNA-binding transcriptional regulator [Microbacterium sp. UFMG61]|uniref:LacI family DNA-binding transcriptional regulator n=1 Tax=Microbacterium sp. UFMG61 TaxID=2745935 RepID=UPI00188F89BD|nr:LacI family DNA-binding transcriptional regulator [Microbacterium sp. UFMG61]